MMIVNMNSLKLLAKFIVVWLSLAFSSVWSPLKASSEDGWTFVAVDESSYRISDSIDAQQGRAIAVIDGSRLTFPIEYQPIRKYNYQPFMPRGYLYQSIRAEPYVSKHLHISGFARSRQPNFAELEKQFSDYHDGAQELRLLNFLNNFSEKDKPEAKRRFDQANEGEYQAELDTFKEFIRHSHKNSQYGISVLLDMGEGRWGQPDIRTHWPTSTGTSHSKDLWYRFNVEVSVPRGCRSISIVLWQSGIVIAEFDHLVVSELGGAIETSAYGISLKAPELLEKIVEKRDLKSQFINLSFE